MSKPDYQKEIQRRLDQSAIVFSGLCTIHCLLTPILFILVPVLGTTLVTVESFHQILLWFVLPVSLLALLLGYFRRRDKTAFLLGFIGLSQLVAAAFLGDGFLNGLGEVVITPLGSLILIAGHIRNYQQTACHEFVPGSCRTPSRSQLRCSRQECCHTPTTSVPSPSSAVCEVN